MRWRQKVPPGQALSCHEDLSRRPGEHGDIVQLPHSCTEHPLPHCSPQGFVHHHDGWEGSGQVSSLPLCTFASPSSVFSETSVTHLPASPLSTS